MARRSSCSTSHTLLLKKLEDYDPETVSEITGVPADVIERVAVEYAKAKPPASGRALALTTGITAT